MDTAEEAQGHAWDFLGSSWADADNAALEPDSLGQSHVQVPSTGFDSLSQQTTGLGIEPESDFTDTYFPDIGKLGDPTWTVKAIVVIMLSKIPPQPTWKWLPHPESLSTFLTLERLNVWSSKGCDVRTIRKTEDVERVWEWIQTNHSAWVDYFPNRPHEAHFAIKTVMSVLLEDLTAQIWPPLSSTEQVHLMIEHVFGEESRVSQLGLVFRPSTAPDVWERLVQHLWDLKSPSCRRLFDLSRDSPYVAICLDQNDSAIAAYLEG